LKEPIKWLQFDGRKNSKSSSKSISNIYNEFLSDAEKGTKKEETLFLQTARRLKVSWETE
jgi:hypothetical protein